MKANQRTSVAFRVDASLDIGTGHVMRCLTLADTLAACGVECRFICREHPGHLIGHIRNKGYRVDALPAINENAHPTESQPHAHWLGCHWETDAVQTKAILTQSVPDWLVVDHYALDARWEKALQGCYRKLMVIDDLADRPHVCDLLLDQNLGREPGDYEALVPAYCRRLIGPQYALLRPEFAALREYSLQRRRTPELKHLLITMGGVDQINATSKVLKALKASLLPPECQITVVMGARAPWLEQVRSLATTMPWPTTVRVSISDMAQVMADSDLAIGAAGSTSWELCCLGVPSLLVCVANNQLAVITALASASAAVQLDLAELNQPDGAPFRAQHAKLIDNLEAYAAAAARVTDGCGAERVCAQLV